MQRAKDMNAKQPALLAGRHEELLKTLQARFEKKHEPL